MKGKWAIENNIIVLDSEKGRIVPLAEEIFSLAESCSGTIQSVVCNSPFEELGLRCSSIGCPVKARIESTEGNKLHFSLFIIKNKIEYEVGLYNGRIIDHLVVNNVWVYLTGPLAEIESILNRADIHHTGIIQLKSYLKVLELATFDNIQLVELCLKDDFFEDKKQAALPAPLELKATLFPYQEKGFGWISYMLGESGGCILGDEMGLGKTMQVIATMLHLKGMESVPMLVIAPLSLLTNWRRECEKFAPSLNILVHYGTDRVSYYRDFDDYDVVITSYTTVASDIDMLNMIDWELVVLDEAQNIKNPYSNRTRVCKRLRRERSIAVSGTPFENHVTDIWSLMDFVMPGFLGSLSQYSEYVTDDVAGGRIIEPILSPLMIRRKVLEVAQDLPEKVVISQPVKMSVAEAEDYERYRQDVLQQYDAENVNIGALQKLRQYCTHPSIVNEHTAGLDPIEVSLKYQRFCEILEEVIACKEKVIVFTSYKKMFDVFLSDLPDRYGIKVWKINGETPIEERQGIVDIFNAQEKPAVLVLNPRAAGTGLNITGANHVVHYNLEWNPSLEDQSSARAYRRGQTKTVLIYRLFYEGTVEEVINERIERKREIADSAVVGNDGERQSRQDIIKALSLIPRTN